MIKNLPPNAGDVRRHGFSLWVGKTPRRGRYGNPLQYSCLENLMYIGAWRDPVHGVARVRYNLVTKPLPP